MRKHGKSKYKNTGRIFFIEGIFFLLYKSFFKDLYVFGNTARTFRKVSQQFFKLSTNNT
jgi:hypothetical protein